jgi:alpha-glucosidase
VKEIEIDNVIVSYDKMACINDNYLIVEKEFTELHIIGE